MNRKSSLVLLATVAFLTRIGSASAFTVIYDSGNQRNVLPWTATTLTFDTNLSNCPGAVSGGTLTAAIQEAMDLWNGVPTSYLKVQLGSEVSTTPAQAQALTSGNPVIVCDTAFSATTSADGDFVVGVGSVNSVDGAWHAKSGAVLLNAESGKDGNIANHVSRLAHVIAHEIGHVLTLGHSSDIHALMYYDATARTELALGQDDHDGITFLYPRSEPGNGGMFACGSVTSGGSSGGPSSGSGSGLEFAFVLLACAAATVLARSRRGPAR